jgi:hypothetical protein
MNAGAPSFARNSAGLLSGPVSLLLALLVLVLLLTLGVLAI